MTDLRYPYEEQMDRALRIAFCIPIFCIGRSDALMRSNEMLSFAYFVTGLVAAVALFMFWALVVVGLLATIGSVIL